MMLWVVSFGDTLPSPSIVVPSLIAWPVASILPTRTKTRPASAGFHMNPPRTAAVLDELASLSRRERARRRSTLPDIALFLDRAAAPIGPWLPKARKPFRSGWAAIRSSAVLRTVVDVLGHAVAVADQLHVRDVALM